MALHDCLCNIHHFWVVFHHFIYDENIYVINLCHLPSPHSFIYNENIYIINPWKYLTIRSKYHLYDLFPRQNKYGYLKILFFLIGVWSHSFPFYLFIWPFLHNIPCLPHCHSQLEQLDNIWKVLSTVSKCKPEKVGSKNNIAH